MKGIKAGGRITRVIREIVVFISGFSVEVIDEGIVSVPF